MKMFIAAALVALVAGTAQASSVCNPEQEACPVDRVGGTPQWVSDINDWFATHLPPAGEKICNPEQEACEPAQVGGVPQWVSDMNDWFVQHGAQQTNPFNDNTGN